MCLFFDPCQLSLRAADARLLRARIPRSRRSRLPAKRSLARELRESSTERCTFVVARTLPPVSLWLKGAAGLGKLPPPAADPDQALFQNHVAMGSALTALSLLS